MYCNERLRMLLLELPFAQRQRAFLIHIDLVSGRIGSSRLTSKPSEGSLTEDRRAKFLTTPPFLFYCRDADYIL